MSEQSLPDQELRNAALREVVIEPTRGIARLKIKAVWQYRELLGFLIWRDLKVRYKQTALGAGWVLLQPILATLIFTVVFGRLAGIPSDGVPYPLFAFSGLLAWNYFAGALTRSGTSLIQNVNLVTKVYFPRLIIPIAGVLAGLVDFAIAFVTFLALLLIYGIPPAWKILLVPAFLLISILAAFGASLWLSALSVRYRDVNHLLPFLIQVWMYATPVVYPASLFPARWRPLLGLNPMAGIVEGFRWALVGETAFPGSLLLISIVTALLLVISGLMFFSTAERAFADII